MKMQEVIEGEGSLRHLGQIIRRYGPQNIFLVRGATSYTASGAADILQSLPQPPDHDEWIVRSSHVSDTETEAARTAIQKVQPDLILAIGGGVVIDMAKILRLLLKTDRSVSDIAVHDVPVYTETIPLLAVPTTAGSGSEATPFAVIYIGQKKYSIEAPAILPDTVFLDPTLTYSLSPLQTAISGVDALAQGIESFWSIHATEHTQQEAAAVIRDILHALPIVVSRPENSDMRAVMLRSAYRAGKCIARTKTTAAHALSYPMTAYFGVAHGQAVALTLPEIFLYNSQVTREDVLDPRGVAYVRHTMKSLCALLGVSSPDAGREKLRAFIQTVGLQTALPAVGIHTSADLKQLASDVDSHRLGNNPRNMTSDAIENILQTISINTT